MSALTIDAAAVVGDPAYVGVRVRLTDMNGTRVAGYTASEVIVSDYTGRTDAEGVLTLDIEPNANITPANTYYTVTIGSFASFLIEKGAGAETLQEAIAIAPSALGLAARYEDLADVDMGGIADGDVPVWDAGTATWLPGAGGGGGGVVDSVVAGARITVDATDPANPIVAADAAPVLSVNSNVGAVVLTAADVGADTAGAAAAAQAASQPLDSDLTAIAALTTTAFGRSLLELANAGAARTALGLGSLAVLSIITSSEITDGTIVNGDISASAAIALSKLATDPLARANHTGTQAGSTVDAATDAARGTVELATATEVLTGTDTGRAPTPSVLAPFAAHTRVSGALAETVPRHFPASAITLTSGRLHLVAVSLPAGLTITSITFVSGAGLSGLSNQWFGLFDSSRVPLRLTGDDTSTAWALNTAKTLNLSSTYATTTAGLYYLGICVVASGMGTIAAQASTVIMTGFAPIISGSSSTGLTNPASCPNPAGALTATSTIPFAYVS